jgi:hypothetical protein
MVWGTAAAVAPLRSAPLGDLDFHNNTQCTGLETHIRNSSSDVKLRRYSFKFNIISAKIALSKKAYQSFS